MPVGRWAVFDTTVYMAAGPGTSPARSSGVSDDAGRSLEIQSGFVGVRGGLVSLASP
jgi:hypothetical protein